MEARNPQAAVSSNTEDFNVSANQGPEPRRASFPVNIINQTQILANEPRSCSANDTATHFQERDEPAERPTEARTAFEAVTPLNTEPDTYVPHDSRQDSSDFNGSQIDVFKEATSAGNSSSDEGGSTANALPSDLPPSMITDQERRSFSALTPEVPYLHQDKGPRDVGTEEDRRKDGAARIHRLKFPIPRAVTMESEEPVLLTDRKSRDAYKPATDDHGAAHSRNQESVRVCSSTATTTTDSGGSSQAPALLKAAQKIAATSKPNEVKPRESGVHCGKARDLVEADDQFDETTRSVGFPSSKKAPTEAGQQMTFCDVALSLTRWKAAKMRANKQRNESIAKDPSHQHFMNKTANRIKTRLPRPLRDSILEEAYPILLRTAQAYKSQLGSKHKFTVQAYERVAELAEDLKTQY